MKSIENRFFDNEGNHIMVALDFYDEFYKQGTLQIPKEYTNIDIVDINVEKVHIDKPINHAVFFKMTSWLLQQFEHHDNAIFTYICSTDEIVCNHNQITPQLYRWTLFDRLFQRIKSIADINVQDIIVGSEEYKTYGRAFYRIAHAPIVHIVSAYLQEKQRQCY